LFVHFGGDPLAAYQFGHTLKLGLKTIGLPLERFSSHSFRIGAATSAASCGLSDECIMNMGGWKSAAYKLYI
jgi:hypothetical protein